MMNIHQPFIGKKTPEEYVLEENLKRLKNATISQRIRQRVRRKMVRLLVILAHCIFKNAPIKEKIKPTQLQRVLVLRWDLIGDMVLTTPVFNFLKSLQPSIEIDVLASKKNVGVIKGDTRISRIFILEKNISFLKTIWQMRRRNYNLVLSFIEIKPMADGLLSNLLAPKALKASAKRKARYRPFFNVCSSAGVSQAHAVDKFLAVPLAAIEAQPFEPKLSLFISESAKQSAKDFIYEKRLWQFILVNISAGSAYRQWGTSNYIEFLKTVSEQNPSLQFVILSDPNNVEPARQICAAVKSERIVVFPPQDDIQVISALIGESLCVFSPDTSIVHIASAMGRPVIALYTIMGTVPSEWLPYRVPYRAVLADGRVPISSIPVASVVEAFNDLINELLDCNRCA